ncbi:MAG TPA: YvcK family protein [Chthonomonadaceae bacterium]|nr:YvcK family protein [Chthonomonadaceae bacterium]
MSRLRTSLKWLYPGMHVKRWVALAFCGLLIFLVGIGIITQAHAPSSKPLAVRVADWVVHNTHVGLRPGTLGVILAGTGALLCLIALGKLISSLTIVLDPEMAHGGLVDVVYQRRKLSQGRRIVVIGGGTGLSTMLRGLKQYTGNITAIVTVADDGGSSGKIQKQLNILPPGDIRNCLVALADAEPQMTELFQYRFRNSVMPPDAANGVSGSAAAPVAAAVTARAAEGNDGAHVPANIGSNYGEGLRDHAFGNLLIAAMTAINGGDFERAIQETSRVLNIRGRVLPATVTHVRLRGEMEDGSILDGETAIATSPLKIKRISLVPANACPVDDVLEAIAQADVIVLGPGSVFTSIIPNLLVRGIPEAIRRSKARKVYVCNVMTQPGETDGFSAYDHIQAIERHAQQRIFDYVLVNTGRPSQELLEKYRKTHSVLVEPDIDRIKRANYRPIAGNFISQTDVVRHDAGLLAAAIMRLLH